MLSRHFLVDISSFPLICQVKTTSPKKYFVRPNTNVIQPWDACFIRGSQLHILLLLGIFFDVIGFTFTWLSALDNTCLNYAFYACGHEIRITCIFPFCLSNLQCFCLFLFLAWSEVTLQAQQEYPPDMQCKDKFLLQSTIVPPNSDVDDLSPDTVRISFTKDCVPILLTVALYFHSVSSTIRLCSYTNMLWFVVQFNKDGGKTVEECKLRVVYVSPNTGQDNLEDNTLKSSRQSFDDSTVSLSDWYM